MGSDLTLMDAAVQKMRWNEARQKVLAQNIANADTPGYVSKDIDKPDFRALLSSTSALPQEAAQLSETNAKHMDVSGHMASAATGALTPRRDKQPEISPTGNSVVMEDQLLKANENLMDHRLTTTIYQKNIDMIKSSLK